LLSPNGYRAILFDLDGTLRHNHPSAEHTFFDFAVELGLPDSRQKRLEALRWSHYYWAQSPELMSDLDHFQEDEGAFWMNYAQRHLLSFGCPEEWAPDLAAKVHGMMRERFKPEDRLGEEVITTLDGLKEAGFLLGVVSNRTRPYEDVLEKFGLNRYFDCVIAAGVVVAWKPEPEIFRYALKALGLQAKEAIYVGDNYYADVIGAQRAGLCPVLLDPEGVFPDTDATVIRKFSELMKLF
jgi:HAD superfamily hydrolase (TIGR01509 family)